MCTHVFKQNITKKNVLFIEYITTKFHNIQNYNTYTFHTIRSVNFFLFVLGTHSLVFRGYSWLCSQGLFLAMPGGLQGMLETKPSSVICKASIIPLYYCSDPKSLFLLNRKSESGENAQSLRLSALQVYVKNSVLGLPYTPSLAALISVTSR